MIKKILLSLFAFIAQPLVYSNALNGLELCKKEIQENQRDVILGKMILEEVLYAEPIQPWSKLMATALPRFDHLPFGIRNMKPGVFKKRQTGLHSALENVRLAMWGLYGLAAESPQKGIFTEGTFKIQDKDNRLFNFFSSPAQVYKRASTHFEEFRDVNKGGLFEKLFAKVDNGLNIENLPCGKQHILFNKLSDGFIFVKPENHGTDLENLPAHAGELVVAKARKVPLIRNYFNLGSDDAPEYSKERVPEESVKEFSSLLEKLETDQETKKLHKKQAQTFGIRAMKNIIGAYMPDYKAHFEDAKKLNEGDTENLSESYINIPREEAVEQPLDVSSDLSSSWTYMGDEAAEDLSRSWQADIDTKEVKAHQDRDKAKIAHEILEFNKNHIEIKDNPDLRKGNEVIFTQNDFTKLFKGFREGYGLKNFNVRETCNATRSNASTSDVD